MIEAAAAERTGPLLDAGLDDVEPWLASLPRSRMSDLLHRVVLGEGAAVGVELRRELREELGVMDGDGVLDDVEPRTAGELLYAEGALVAARERQEADRRAAAAALAAARAAEAARTRRAALAAEGDAVWARVEAMAVPSIPATYDEVVATLLDLREVLAQQGRAAEFTERVAALRASQARRVTLIRKLAAAGLISPGG